MDKARYRRMLRGLRQGIPAGRRAAAAESALQQLLSISQPYGRVLSFASFGSEIDLWSLNHHLAGEKKLLLPRVEGLDLGLYVVDNLESQLLRSSWGILEPNPDVALRVEAHTIELILVAGLGFDSEGHRIGYGKGYYDRLIDKCSTALSLGVGFKEQLIAGKLPIEEFDRPVSQLCLL